MWSAEVCFEMLLIFSLKGAGERFLFSSCSAKGESNAKMQPTPVEESGEEDSSGKAAWAHPGRLCPSQAIPVSPEHTQHQQMESFFPPCSCWVRTLSILVLGMARKSRLISSLPASPGCLRPIWFCVHKVLYLIKVKPSASRIWSKV